MKQKWHLKRLLTLALSVAIVGTSSLSSMSYVVTDATDVSGVLINEIDMNGDDGDWVELKNMGDSSVDISGWILVDDKGLDDRLSSNEAWIVPDGTVLSAGGIYVLEQSLGADWCGLGKKDMVALYDADKNLIDSYTWTSASAGTYSRDPETLEFVDMEATKGAENVIEEDPSDEGQLVINEINSAPDDWIEFINIGESSVDISGYEIRDNSDDHRWKFADGTVVAAGEIILVTAGSTEGLMYNDTTGEYEAGVFDIGIGSGDSIRLYDDDGNLLDEYSWTSHASYDGQDSLASYGRYPDGTGSFTLTKETPGEANEWYAPQIVINEIESNDPDGGNDWVEIYNAGTTEVDISGYYLLDNDETGHISDVTPVADGTILAPGEFYVFEGGSSGADFTFGLGKDDTATVFNKDGVVIDSYSWTSHASGVYARIPDGTGEFQDFATATKGRANIETNAVVINEVQSNDPDGGPDWIELANPTDEELDISGLIVKDDDDSHEYIIPDETTIEANGFLVIYDTEFGFGLGKGDSVRIYETIGGEQMLIQSTTWPSGTHTSPTWGLYPDVNGSEYRNTKQATPGEANVFEGVPDTIAWNKGNEETDSVTLSDLTFLEDSSGLDFYNGQLYAVDNGTATFWIIDVAKDGTLTLAEGYENGKTIAFQKDADDLTAKGPDAEGITVDEDGFVYIASERDNSEKGVNYDVILKVDPDTEGDRIVAMQEWDITDLLPEVAANMGIEAVEWVSNEDVEGNLFDQNTNDVFDSTNYPDATANGVFFTALEDNGHVYAWVLNSDSTATLIADIDSCLGGAMALDYDTYEGILRVASDNGYSNKMAEITFNGTDSVDIVHVLAPTGLDTTKNYEGFAIATADYTVDGKRPVYRFEDGVTEGSLCVGSIYCDYTEEEISVGLLGDVNDDGKITTADVGLANAQAKGVKTLSDEEFARADINCDGEVTTADVGIINSYAKGVLTIEDSEE